MFRLNRVLAELLSEAVLDGLSPSSLSDTELSNVHLLFEREECALPPAGAVRDELVKRGLL